MKILLVSNSVAGGAGKACYRVLNALLAEGKEVKFLYLQGGSSEGNEHLIPFYNNVRDLFLKQLLNVPLLKWRQAFMGTRGTNYRLPYSFHKLEDHPLVKWADVINVHWVPDFLDYVSFFRKVNKPVIWTMHDMLPFSGGYHFPTENKVSKPQIEEKIKQIKQSAVKGKNLNIVAPSRWLLEVSKQEKTFEGLPHTHIYNPILTSQFKPLDKSFAREALSLPKDGKIIVFSAVSLNAPRKGMKVLLEALQMLDEQNVVLVSIGKGKVNEELKVPYYHLGLMKDEYSIVLLYSAADVSIIPSKEENSPNTIVESLACGCPSIGFNIGGIPEIISSKDYGEVIQNYNADELAAGIRTVLKGEYDREKIHDYIHSEFNYSLIAKRYYSLFEKAIG